MKVALNLESLAPVIRTGEMDIPSCLAFCQSLDVSSIELIDILVRHADLQWIEQALSDAKCSVSIYDLHLDPVSPDPFKREVEAARLKVALQRAAFLGAPLVSVVPGLIKPGVAVEQAQIWYAETLSLAAPQAQRLGIKLAIENVGMAEIGCYCGTSSDINSIYCRSGATVGTVYDAANYVMRGEDPLEAMAALAPSILHVHVKDWLLVSKHAPDAGDAFEGLGGKYYLGAILGSGILDVAATLHRLLANGYDGHICVEYEGTSEPRGALRQAVERLRSIA
ncbi:MAG: sugar phosphate isomerase/epimerase [Candidatus Dormibacteraeota bacterium]|nr:sugar phosphate isomerase/epimerase [Candidatus Dormibacteraeota bacterium]